MKKKLFVFGSTGDLVRKKVLPALDKLYLKRKDFQVIALGRKPFSGKEYIDSTYPASSKEFRESVSYARIDFSNENVCIDCDLIYSRSEVNYFYLSLPPMLLDDALIYIAKVKKSGLQVKILSEKPFGANLNHAKNLYSLIKELDLINDIQISDHYLFKNSIIELQKNNLIKDFNSLKVFSLETVGLEGRDYYDFVGAMNDMLQSHLLNLAFLFFDKEKLAKLDVERVVFGQYLDYEKEMGKKSKTETFFYVKLSGLNKVIEFASGKKIKDKVKIISFDDLVVDFGEDLGTYYKVFDFFFNNINSNFPTIDQSIIAWSIIDKIKSQQKDLVKYLPNSSFQEIIA